MGERPSAPPFDTQRAVEELVRAETDRLRESMELLRENMDLKFEAVEQRIDARFAALETKIAQSATATIKWAATSQIGTAAVYLAALLAAIEF